MSSIPVHSVVSAQMSFVDPEDGFADDDLVAVDDITDIDAPRSFLEREDFESELGSMTMDPFAEDFSDVIKYNIIEILAEGDRVARPIVVIYAYRLPSNKVFDHALFLRYLQATLDQVVDMDYTIVYFHYGLRSNNKPPIRWLLQAYKVLDRRYKKNLKALYVVHPTRFIKILWGLFKPFISSKFENKLHYVNGIRDLEDALSISRLNLPAPIRDYDQSMASSAHDSRPGTPPTAPRPTQQFGVSLQFILDHNPDYDIPPIVSYLIDFLEKNALDVEGIFRKSANVGSIKRLQERINMGEVIDFENDSEYKDNNYVACIHASVLLKTFFRSLEEPVTTNYMYPRLAAISEVPKKDKSTAVKDFVGHLPPQNYMLLKCIVRFLTKVASNHKVNLMTANNLSVVFGPNLAWPTNIQVPINQLNNLNNFCYRLIVDYEQIFS